MARPRAKMLIGALLTLSGIWWYVPGGGLDALLEPYSSITNFQSLIVGLQGGTGVILLLIGIFIVWIERDQLKLQKELQKREQDSTGTEQQAVVGGTMQQSSGTDIEQEVETDGSDTDPEEDSSDEDEGDEESFVCEKCEDTFDSGRGLNVHKSQVHVD